MMSPRLCKAALAGLFFTALFQVASATPIDGSAPLVAREDQVASMELHECAADAYNCCSSAYRLPAMLQALGVVANLVDKAESLVGVQCAPIDLLGLVSQKCKNKPLCCKDRKVSGLLGVACTPIHIDPIDVGYIKPLAKLVN